jgi:subtilisin family serine protease
LVIVLAVTMPVATQGPGSRGGATVMINGAEAVAGDVLVKFAGALDRGERQQLNYQMDADRDEEVGGVGNNAVGVAGVNWIASIMGAKFLNASGSGSTADAINAIEFTRRTSPCRRRRLRRL